MKINIITTWSSEELAWCDYYEHFDRDVASKLSSFSQSHQIPDVIRLFDIIIIYIGRDQISSILLNDIILNDWDEIINLYNINDFPQ